MRTNARRINPEELEHYKQLAKDGVCLADALRATQKRFGLSKPHTRQAVKMRLRNLGLSFKRGTKGKRGTVVIRSGGNEQPSWEQVRDFILSAIEKANHVSDIEHELHKYKAGYENATDLLKKYAKHDDEAKRYRLAVQQGEVKSNLTEHITLYDPKLIANNPVT